MPKRSEEKERLSHQGLWRSFSPPNPRQQVARTPDATALIFEEQRLSYAELDRRSNQLGHYLAAQGIGSEDIVAIALDRSVEMVVSLLGVLKSGAAYLPLDPEYPIDRLAFMLEDSGACSLLTTETILGRLQAGGSALPSVMALFKKSLLVDDVQFIQDVKGLPVTALSDATRARAFSAQNLAYLIYTSGSTGRPKGVGVSHHALCNFISAAQGTIKNSKTARLGTLNAGLGFDVAVWEVFTRITNGHAIFLSHTGLSDVGALIDEVQHNGIDSL